MAASQGDRSKVHAGRGAPFRAERIREGVAALLILALLALSTGCGRYAAPLDPEDLSPAQVGQLKVSTSVDGVRFAWLAPEKDQRDKEVRSLDEYRVYRKELKSPSDLLDPEIEYELIATVPDTFFAEREKLRDAAKAAGKSLRTVRVADGKKRFEYLDRSVEAGKRYAYELVPINQGGVKGDLGSIVQVLFRGDSSEVVLIPVSQTEEQIF